MEFINYAHRGASEYAPENTMPSFELGYRMHANGVETDVQRTKDGVLVLFHDNDLQRICARPEAIHDLTFEQLQELDFGLFKGSKFIGTKITTFEEFLSEFSSKYKYFAIELKETEIEAQTVALIRKYLDIEHVVVTSGIWSTLLKMHDVAPDIKLGYLAKCKSDYLISNAKPCGITQICPKADILDKEWNKSLRDAGYSVRAWGIDSPDTMRRMIALGVDGMTINFPDVLYSEFYKF